MYQYLARRVARATAVAVLFTIPVWAGPQAPAQTQPDNTKVNQRDRAKTAVTADQQKENAADRTITQNIRQSLMKDKTLSSYAHNVKVITMDGQVTFKGPVRSEAEKKTVVAKAVEVAGEDKVTDQISIAPAKTAKR
jgi:osmotically-inducible protein OsmY